MTTDTPRPLPYDEEMERALVGAVLVFPAEVLSQLADTVQPEDLYDVKLARIYGATLDLHHRGEPVNPTTIARHLVSLNGTADTFADLKRRVLELQVETPGAGGAPYYAGVVLRDSRRRARILAASALIDETRRSDDTTEAERHLRAVLDNTGRTPLARAPDLEEFLAGDEPEHDWLVPGLLERGERLILTGLEGKGKSTLLRQTAVQLASGIHPFSALEIQPVQVTLIDLENPYGHLRRELRKLRLAAGDAYEKGRLRIENHPGGIDLTAAEGRAWLRARIAADRPDLVICGPLYKMAGGDPTSEEVTRAVAFFLDEVRSAYGVAIVLEAHTPYATGRSSRPERPFGGSLWSRWPEFGIFLAEDGALRHWRGPRAEREWPAKLKRGGSWPWTVEDNRTVVNFAQLLEVQRATDHRLSERELQDITGIPKTTLHRALAANQLQWDALLEELDR